MPEDVPIMLIPDAQLKLYSLDFCQLSLMEIVVRSYKNLVRNMVSYKIRSFLIRLKILVK